MGNCPVQLYASNTFGTRGGVEGGIVPHLKIEWVIPGLRVKGGRSLVKRILDAQNRKIRWSMAAVV
jgi:hypothetical protein